MSSPLFAPLKAWEVTMLPENEILDMLVGLIDGSRPLPRPHPQRLSFPNDDWALIEIAAITAHIGGHLPPDEVRHLLFKQTAWCSKRGKTTRAAVNHELRLISLPIEMALSCYPKWVKGRAGVGWAVRRYADWLTAADKLACLSYEKPLRVGAVPIENRTLDLVELTNAAHVHREGKSLEHCMYWSVNHEALEKHGYPKLGSPQSLECLTYAVKLRHGELRIFSVHLPSGRPKMTVAYNKKSKRVLAQGFREDAYEWSLLKCAAVHAVAGIVHIDTVYSQHHQSCDERCPVKGWCKANLKFENEWGELAVPPTVIYRGSTAR
jgi:hypothetical protein